MESAVLKIGSNGADWGQGNSARQKKRPQRGADALRPLQSDARQVTWGVDLSVPPPALENPIRVNTSRSVRKRFQALCRNFEVRVSRLEQHLQTRMVSVFNLSVLS